MNTIKFKIRCSAINSIMAGNVGLTDKQAQKLLELQTRDRLSKESTAKPLTDNMREEMEGYQHIFSHPELPEGLKTYCKQWLKEHLYKRRQQIKSKYIEKGHGTEEDGFTAMSVQLGLGMTYKNEAHKSNDFMAGTCDLDHATTDTVYDNKSSWSLDTFPMFETECPSADYIAQIQGYMHLWGRKKGAVVYTLNDIPEAILIRMMYNGQSDDEKQEAALPLIYTRKYWDEIKAKYFSGAKDIDFVEIPEKDRVKAFYVDYDPAYIAKVEERVALCQEFINTLIKK